MQRENGNLLGGGLSKATMLAQSRALLRKKLENLLVRKRAIDVGRQVGPRNEREAVQQRVREVTFDCDRDAANRTRETLDEIEAELKG